MKSESGICEDRGSERGERREDITLTSLAFLSEFLLILLSCMKLKEEERMPFCELYSMDF